VDDPHQVHLDDVSPVVERVVFGLAADASAGVVEEIVEPTVAREDSGHRRIERRGVTHVEPQGLAPQASRERGGLGLLPVGEDHLRALPGERLRPGGADPGGASGDQRDSVFVSTDCLGHTAPAARPGRNFEPAAKATLPFAPFSNLATPDPRGSGV
jgi:hypothetical protein